MALPPPKFIPMSKGNSAALAFENFRDGTLGAKTPSPALRGKQHPSPAGTGKRSPQAAPAKSPALTSQSIVATLKDCDGALNDYIVEVADNKIASKQVVAAYLLTSIEADAPNKVAVLSGRDIPRPFFDIAEFGEPVAVPLTREPVTEESPARGVSDSVGSNGHNSAHLPFKTPLAVSQSIQRAVREAAAKEEADGDLDRKGGAPGELPPMELPPSQDAESKPAAERAAPVSRFLTDKLVCIFYGSKEDAEKAVGILEAAFPSAEIRITPRRRSVLNSTLVVKGLPYQTKVDILGEHIASNLNIAPSYIRTHRNERGVFKCVLFIKFASRAKAELAKFELERMNVGSHPLRVEYKKPQKEALPIVSGNSGPTPSSHIHLEQAIQTLCGSNENEGLSFDPQNFSHEAVRYLAHLCLARDLSLDLVPFGNLPHLSSAEQHTPGKAFVVRRANAAQVASIRAGITTISPGRGPSTHTTPSLGPKSGAGTPSGMGIMDRGIVPPSPALNPSPTDPCNQSWSTATPSSLKPMEFRGIRHWKEARQQTNVAEVSTLPTGPSLGILRPNGPGSGPAFSSGRGRPVAHA